MRVQANGARSSHRHRSGKWFLLHARSSYINYMIYDARMRVWHDRFFRVTSLYRYSAAAEAESDRKRMRIYIYMYISIRSTQCADRTNTTSMLRIVNGSCQLSTLFDQITIYVYMRANTDTQHMCECQAVRSPANERDWWRSAAAERKLSVSIRAASRDSLRLIPCDDDLKRVILFFAIRETDEKNVEKNFKHRLSLKMLSTLCTMLNKNRKRAKYDDWPKII